MPLSKTIRVSTSVSLLALTANGFSSIPSSFCVSQAKNRSGKQLNVHLDEPWSSASMQDSFASNSRSTVATVPFMMTNKMKRVLIEELRYSRREVNGMNPDTAHDIVNNRIPSRSRAPLQNGYTEDRKENIDLPDESLNNRISSSSRPPLPNEEKIDPLAPDESSSDFFQLEEMHNEFADLSEKVLQDDRYGPLFPAEDNAPQFVETMDDRSFATQINAPHRVEPMNDGFVGTQDDGPRYMETLDDEFVVTQENNPPLMKTMDDRYFSIQENNPGLMETMDDRYFGARNAVKTMDHRSMGSGRGLAPDDHFTGF